MENKAIALVSGGMDTLATIHLCSHNTRIIKGIFFNYGQIALEKEREYAHRIGREYDFEVEEIELALWKDAALTITGNGDIPEDNLFTNESAENVWVPARNLVFISIAASVAEKEKANHIVAGFNATEGATFPDNSKEFLDGFNNLLKYATLNDIEILSPLVEKGKDTVASIIVNSNNMDNFWSCYRNNEKMCGKCESCRNVKRAFKKIDKYDLVKHRFEEI